MKLPRWTVYPALGVLAILLVTALPHTGEGATHSGFAKRARQHQAAMRQGVEQPGTERHDLPMGPKERQVLEPAQEDKRLTKHP